MNVRVHIGIACTVETRARTDKEGNKQRKASKATRERVFGSAMMPSLPPLSRAAESVEYNQRSVLVITISVHPTHYLATLTHRGNGSCLPKLIVTPLIHVN